MTSADHAKGAGAVRWMAEMAGFGALDARKTQAALLRLSCFAAVGLGLAVAGPFVGITVLPGMLVLALSVAVLCGAVLIGADMNSELAVMLMTTPSPKATPAVAPAPVAVLPVAPPPLPLLSSPTRPASKALQVLSRGHIEGRPYAVFTDGSIELETMFGPRWFASVDLAHEFIGYRNGASVQVAQMALAS